jgi:hypothetical protein
MADVADEIGDGVAGTKTGKEMNVIVGTFLWRVARFRWLACLPPATIRRPAGVGFAAPVLALRVTVG